MDYSKLNSLRNIARKTGLIKAISFPARYKQQQREREFDKLKPSQVHLEGNGFAIEMLTGDRYEYKRVKSFVDDLDIIGAINKRLNPGDSCWDIGASIGLYSNSFAKVVGENGTVVSFEPELRSRERLQENIALNGNLHIKVYNVALGDQAGKLHLLLADKASAGTHRVVTEHAADQQVQEIEVLTADEFIKREGLPIPSAIKLDVEGQEELVIKGAATVLGHPDCKTFVCEVHFAILSSRGDVNAPNRIKDMLVRYGFKKIEWLDSSHLLATK
jgi:FkbM family methyltransferase